MTNATDQRIAVIGAGSWGTALARHLSDKGAAVSLWGHRAGHIQELITTRENKKYLAGFPLSEKLLPTNDIREAVTGCRLVVMVTPSHVSRGVLETAAPEVEKDAMIISASKGIENETLLTMTQVMKEVLPGNFADRVGILSGPSFAKEVAQGTPTAVTVAAPSREVAAFVQQAFNTEKFRVYTSSDVIGVELGGALKNIVAIAAGICDGLGFGTNTRAALVTRGLVEIARLGVKMGANPHTFSGLAGLGDLVLTCTGDLSRNRYVGMELGKGKKLSAILDEMSMVAEGVKTTRSAFALAQKVGVEMPILEQVYQVLYMDKPCLSAVQDLMTRDLKEELEF